MSLPAQRFIVGCEARRARDGRRPRETQAAYTEKNTTRRVDARDSARADQLPFL
jgi:hypothetical protein